MTAIVGYVAKDGAVYLGGDSAATDNDIKIIQTEPKVWRLTPHLVIGVSGAGRLNDLVRVFLPRHLPDETTLQSDYVVHLAEALRDLLKNHGCVTETKGQIEADGSFLVGYAGVLYSIDCAFSVVKHSERIAARGCAKELALGALHTLETLTEDDGQDYKPAFRLEMALEAAARFDIHVAPPWTFVQTDPIEAAVLKLWKQN